MTEDLNEKDKWLAAEFAMGVLERSSLQAAEKRFEEDPVFRKAVEEWQSNLSPLNDDVMSVDPDPKLWQAIAQRTNPVVPEQKTGLWSSLTFWRSFSALTGSLAAAALVLILITPGNGLLTNGKGGQSFVATLTSTGEAPAFMARFNSETGLVNVQSAAREAADTRVAELWLIPSDGIPRSLGLLGDSGQGQFQVSEENRLIFDQGTLLAVSLEPSGGSPTGAPTGPVIASGKVQQF